jgi:DNA-binding winged helix-turn-helix (wHTH) protein
MIYNFSNCRLDTDRRELFRGDVLVPVEPQVFDLLHILAENPARVVTRDEIIDRVWGGRIVSESAISARISAARKAVGDDGKSQSIIRTIQRRGLQFVAEIRERKGSTVGLIPTPQVRYATSDYDKSLAYAVTGNGPRLIRVPATPADIGMEWELPGLRAIVEAISAEFELLRYDGFGFGMSDRDIEEVDNERDADDCRAVADAAGWDRFAVYSESGACFEAIHFAAKYPERVSQLVLLGGYAEGRIRRSQSVEPDILRAMIRESWESEEDYFARAFMLAYTPEGPMPVVGEMAHMMRASGTTEAMTMLRDAVNNYSVLHLLSKVQCPTLIVHGRKDAVHPLSEGKKLAAGIPNAELLVLETANHLPLFGHPTWDVYFEAFCRFLKPAS